MSRLGCGDVDVVRVVVIGGTRFIGRRITEQLVNRGDEVLVVHRGAAEPENWVRCRHLHVDRKDFGRVASQVRQFAPDTVVDTLAMTRADVDAVLPHLPDVPLVMLSSMDVYRAYELVMSGRAGIAVPFGEDAPLREAVSRTGAPIPASMATTSTWITTTSSTSNLCISSAGAPCCGWGWSTAKATSSDARSSSCGEYARAADASPLQ